MLARQKTEGPKRLAYLTIDDLKHELCLQTVNQMTEIFISTERFHTVISLLQITCICIEITGMIANSL